MSSLANAILEAFQRDAHSKTGKAMLDQGTRLLEGVDFMVEVAIASGMEAPSREDLLREHAAIPLPTPIQDPFNFAILSDIRARMDLDPRVVLGTAPTGRTNARVLRTPNGLPPVVVFDDGLFTFAWLCAKAVAQIVPIVVRDGVAYVNTTPARMAEHDAATGGTGMYRLRNAMMAYMVRGNPMAAQRYMLTDPQQLALASNLVECWEMFALAHEFGHVALKHLDEPATDGEGEEEPSSAKVRELDADLFALQAVQTHGPSVHEAVLGASLYLLCANALEKGLSYFHHGVAEDLPGVDSHPPPMHRFEWLSREGRISAEDTAIVAGLEYAFEDAVVPSLAEAIDIARTERGEVIHAIWSARWNEGAAESTAGEASG